MWQRHPDFGRHSDAAMARIEFARGPGCCFCSFEVLVGGSLSDLFVASDTYQRLKNSE